MTVVEVVLTTSAISVTNLVMVLVEGFCLGISPPTPPRRLFLLPEEFFSSTREMKSLVMDGTLNGWLFLLECGTSSSTADRLAGGAVTVTVFQTMLVWVSALETVTSTVDTTVEDSILTTRMVARCVAIRVVVSKIVLVIVTVSTDETQPPLGEHIWPAKQHPDPQHGRPAAQQYFRSPSRQQFPQPEHESTLLSKQKFVPFARQSRLPTPKICSVRPSKAGVPGTGSLRIAMYRVRSASESSSAAMKHKA